MFNNLCLNNLKFKPQSKQESKSNVFIGRCVTSNLF